MNKIMSISRSKIGQIEITQNIYEQKLYEGLAF